jgi:hypothetical protein
LLVGGTVLEEGESLKGSILAGTWNGENGEVGVEGYFKFVLSEMGAAPILGLSFGVDEKRLLDLFFSLKRLDMLKMGFLLLNLRGRGSLKFWNAP